ncbi:MAG: penicillin acylase family protein, partial [Myxococcota bacterium]
WAVDGTRTARGSALLCGDPHLGINQLPSLFMEFRAHVGANYWLGATIPGLPGIGVGRNRHVAWAGTFAVADNVDFTVEELTGGAAERSDGVHPVATREVEIRRRFRSPVKVTFHETDRGVLERPEGVTLASRWAGGARPWEAIESYMVAPDSKSLNELVETMNGAHPFSLHFVFAERGGALKYRQGGRIPKRSGGWTGLYPARAERADWSGFHEGAGMIRRDAADGVVVSANEARQADDGTWLATLAQPAYRYDRIRDQLLARRDHDVESMKAIQLDLTSLQAQRLKDTLLEFDPSGELRSALEGWEGHYGAESREAYLFEQIRDTAVEVLSEDLGGPWLVDMHRETEIATWWASGLDRLIGDPATWAGARGSRLKDRLGHIRSAQSR